MNPNYEFKNEATIEIIDLTIDESDNSHANTGARETMDESSDAQKNRNANKTPEPCTPDSSEEHDGSNNENWISEVGQGHLASKVKAMRQEWQEKFKTGSVYESTYSLRDAVSAFAASFNLGVSTASHKPLKKIEIICKHGGSYRNHHKKDDSLKGDANQSRKPRKTKSTKTGCPCSISAKYDVSLMKVIITSSIFAHNHPLAEDVRTYALNRKLEVNNFDLARTLLKSNKPAVVLKVP